MTDERTAWFIFKIEDSDPDGVEPSKLARLLTELSSALYAIARLQINEAPNRPGRRTSYEDAIAGARVKRIEPGSTTIEFVPPLSSDQPPLFSEEPDADSVIAMFAETIETLSRNDSVSPPAQEVGRRVRAVIDRAGDIGSKGSVFYNPRPGHHAGREIKPLRVAFRSRELSEPAMSGVPVTVRRQVVGRAYMADVEPGRERMRLKLRDGRDLTLEVDSAAAQDLKSDLEQVVEVDVAETFEEQTAPRRTVERITVLADASAYDPPRTLEEIERELKLPQNPDYVALATAVWRTRDELHEFVDRVREIRRPASDDSLDDD